METALYPAIPTRPHRSAFSTLNPSAFTLVEIMVVVAVIGILAAMGIPAFKRIHQTSQDRTILNNARQISAAADQYFMEVGGTTVALTSLVGSSLYIKSITTVASESYPVNIVAGSPIIITGIAGSRTITFEH